MNWFDTKTISSLLKEAQKQIDKALDIKDDEEEEKEELVSPHETFMDDSTLGANWKVTENDEPITKSPTTKIRSTESSESLEVLSKSSLSPVTPNSELISPLSSEPTLHESDSVEVISAYDTSKGISQINSLITSPTSPGSVELLTDDTDSAIEAISPIDDPSTLNTEVPVTVKDRLPITTAPSRSGLRLNISCTSVEEIAETSPKSTINRMNESNDSDKTIVSTEASMEMCEIRTVSDSTTSFEEICPAIRTYQSIPAHVLTDNENENASPRKENRKTLVGKTNSSGEEHSADELETGTSSDIEVISSPSTNNSAYRESPMKQTADKSSNESMVIIKKGHFREPSEVSIQSTNSEDSHFSNQSETEKLLKRINELSEILEQRENKLLEIGRRNSELAEQNAEMQARLNAKLNDPLELTNVTEEYTQRLSALEKKFQQTIREKEAFRKELSAMKQEFVGKVSKSELEKKVGERDGLIGELRMEGEKLSKQILNLNNIIKKLRAKEKENDTQTKSHKDQIAGLTEETDRLKKSLSAKEDMERSQIEAVHKLSSEIKKFDEENSVLKSKHDDLTQKFDTLKASFDAAKKELLDLKQENKDVSKKLSDVSALHLEQHESQAQELKKKWLQSEEQKEFALNSLRQENTNLLRQLEDAELRLQEQIEAYSTATVPLMKQIESLRAQVSNKTTLYEKRETELTRKLDEAQSQIRQISASETGFKEKVLGLKNQTVTLETRLSDALHQIDEMSVNLQSEKLELDKIGMVHRQEIDRCRHQEKELEEKIRLLEKKLAETEEKLKRKNVTEADITQEDDDERTYTNEPRNKGTLLHEGRTESSEKMSNSSPTLSLSLSLADSYSWQPVSNISFLVKF